MHRRNIILRIILVCLLVYSVVSYAAGLKELNELEAENFQARTELAQLRLENSRLEESAAAEVDEEEILRMAEEKLGLSLPGEKIFIFSKDREEPSWGLK